jgi:hypothetical protein
MTGHLVQGVDLWINTARRPWEASGTSGMKVLVNGILSNPLVTLMRTAPRELHDHRSRSPAVGRAQLALATDHYTFFVHALDLTRRSRNQTRLQFQELEHLAKCPPRPVAIGWEAHREIQPAMNAQDSTIEALSSQRSRYMGGLRIWKPHVHVPPPCAGIGI